MEELNAARSRLDVSLGSMGRALAHHLNMLENMTEACVEADQITLAVVGTVATADLLDEFRSTLA